MAHFNRAGIVTRLRCARVRRVELDSVAAGFYDGVEIGRQGADWTCGAGDIIASRRVVTSFPRRGESSVVRTDRTAVCAGVAELCRCAGVTALRSCATGRLNRFRTGFKPVPRDPPGLRRGVLICWGFKPVSRESIR